MYTFIDVFWNRSVSNDINHYEVQIDSHPPYHVSAENTTFHWMIEYSELYASRSVRPVVSVVAVDECGQASNASIEEIEDFMPSHDIEGMHPQQPTIASQQTYDLPTTGKLLGMLV